MPRASRVFRTTPINADKTGVKRLIGVDRRSSAADRVVTFHRDHRSATLLLSYGETYQTGRARQTPAG
jgi:hypothetical protein